MSIEDTSTIVYLGDQAKSLKCRCYYQSNKNSVIVLILPPDPRFGGNIDNDVVIAAEQAFRKCGLSTLAVNYHISKDEKNLASVLDGAFFDVYTVLDWIFLNLPDVQGILLCGYSFGAYVATVSAMRRPDVSYFVAISPLVSQYDFSQMCPMLCEGAMIAGEQDEFIPSESFNNIVEQMNEVNRAMVDKIIIDGANHKYKGKLQNLQEAIENYVNIKLATRVAIPVRKKRRKRAKKNGEFNV